MRLDVRLETSDGGTVEVDPPVVVYITTSDGQEYPFRSPLRATFEGGAVQIKHNCGRPQTIQGDDILKVEVEEYYVAGSGFSTRGLLHRRDFVDSATSLV